MKARYINSFASRKEMNEKVGLNTSFMSFLLSLSGLHEKVCYLAGLMKRR